MSSIMNQLRQILAPLIAGVFLFVGIILFSNPHRVEAMAKPLTPEAAEYEIEKPGSPLDKADRIVERSRNYTQNELPRDTAYTQQAIKNRAEEARKKAQELGDRTRKTGKKALNQGENKFQDAFENVKEKLNLDEPIPESTREFLRDVKGQTDEAVAPITGPTSGYYSVPSSIK